MKKVFMIVLFCFIVATGFGVLVLALDGYYEVTIINSTDHDIWIKKVEFYHTDPDDPDDMFDSHNISIKLSPGEGYDKFRGDTPAGASGGLSYIVVLGTTSKYRPQYRQVFRVMGSVAGPYYIKSGFGKD